MKQKLKLRSPKELPEPNKFVLFVYGKQKAVAFFSQDYTTKKNKIKVFGGYGEVASLKYDIFQDAAFKGWCYLSDLEFEVEDE